LKRTRQSMLIITLTMVILAGCTGGSTSDEATPTPIDNIALITQAANLIRSVETFRMDVSQEGPDYIIPTVYANVFFRRANAQYVSPGTMQASIRVVAAGLPISIDVFSRGANQWYRAIWTGNNWLNEAFAAGFNPEALIAEDTGFNAALQALIDLDYVGQETLESGVTTHHLRGTAQGEDVNALLVGLIETVGIVVVDIYVDVATGYPVRFMITEENSPYAVTPQPGEQAEPVVWIMDIYAINEPAQLDDPEMETVEATAESTPESTP